MIIASDSPESYRSVMPEATDSAERAADDKNAITLDDFFRAHPRVAVAFSGGVDSAYLLYEAKRCGADVRAYYVNTAFQPAFELADARRLAGELDVPLTEIELDVLAVDRVADNPAGRCYDCKRAIFGAILAAAHGDGFTDILDGTNASDDAADRPGMRALAELRVWSPLRRCGLTKDEIRRRSKEAGLFTWNKPAYACLATRIPTGMRMTEEALARTEQAENALFAMGFKDFRVRTTPTGGALVQVTEAQMHMAEETFQEIRASLGAWYPVVRLDSVPRDG